MQLTLTILLIIALAGIVYSDLKHLSIPLILLLVAIIIAALRIGNYNPMAFALKISVLNLMGTVTILALAVLILFLLRGKVFNPVNSLIGSGDLLFFPIICTSFSPINYIAFFCLSCMLIIFYRYTIGVKRKQIPFAGLQSLLLISTLIIAEIFSFNLYADQPILNSLLVN